MDVAACESLLALNVEDHMTSSKARVNTYFSCRQDSTMEHS